MALLAERSTALPVPAPVGLTYYASPNRVTQAEIMDQYRTFAAHAHVEAALDATGEVVLVLNEDRQLIFVNSRAIAFLGATTRRQVLGQRFGEAVGCERANIMPAGCGTSPACAVCGLAQAVVRSLKGKPATGECRITRGEQHEPLELRVHVVPFSAGGLNLLVVTAKDISDENRRNALERVFFHDVSNTAGALGGYAELLQDAEGADVEEFRSTIQMLSAQLFDEIQAQRALSMAEHGDLMPTVRPTTSTIVIQEILRQFERSTANAGKSLRWERQGPACAFETDIVLLRRTIGNMVKNALEATRAGGTVTIGTSTGPHTIRFWVHNPEVMPSNVQKQVFQRSFSTKGPGRGLGTYSMRLMTERYLNGSVSFESSKDAGTRFIVEIPLPSPA